MPAAAKQDDTIYNQNETHIVMVPSASGQTPTPVLGHIFNAPISEDVSPDVNIEGKAAAVVGSGAKTNLAQHPAMPPGVSYQPPGPSFEGRITMGSRTVFINGKPAARHGDPAITCNDPPTPPPGTGQVRVTRSTVNIG
jgi:uncharacterized Zn-binding protein involved in type VI secretion